MKTDSIGRKYGVKTCYCTVCGLEMTYTHNPKKFCNDCYSKRHVNEVTRWRAGNPEAFKAMRKRELVDKKNRRAKKKAELDLIKLNSGCVDCGYRGHPSALDFDHVTGTKLFTLSQCLDKPRSQIEAELVKCEVVCANCHRIRSCTRLEQNQ